VILGFGTLVQAVCVSIAVDSGAPCWSGCNGPFSVAATRLRALPLDALRGFESCRRSPRESLKLHELLPGSLTADHWYPKATAVAREATKTRCAAQRSSSHRV